MSNHNKKDDMIMVRINKDLKKAFTNINKENNIKNSQKIREWIQIYVETNKKSSV